MNRVIDSTRACAITRIAKNAASRYGLDHQAAKEVARYGLSLFLAGNSAGRAIAKAVRYARVRSGRSLWV